MKETVESLTKRMLSLIEKLDELESLLDLLSKENDRLEEENQKLIKVLKKYADAKKSVSHLEAKEALHELGISKQQN